MSLLIIFTFAIFCVQNIMCLRKVYCEPNDEVCITNSVNERVFPKLLAGVSGIDSSDPLRLNTLEVNLPYLRLTLTNATMTGAKDCVLHVKKNEADTLFDYEPCCPHLTIESEYEAEGQIDAVSVKGKGTFKISYENFNFKIIGSQMKVTHGDCKQYIRILNYTTHLDLKGKSAFDYKNLSFGDTGRCKCTTALRSKYYDRFEEITRKPIMEAFVQKFMINVQDFHTAVPVEELYFMYV